MSEELEQLRQDIAGAIYDTTGLRGEAWTEVSDVASEHALADHVMAVVAPIVAERDRLRVDAIAQRLALDEVTKHAEALRAERDRWVEQNGRLAEQRDEARRVVKQVNDNCADFAEALGLPCDAYGDEIIAAARELRESRFRWAEEAARLEAERREAIDLLVDLQVLECADDAEGKTLADLASMGRPCGLCDGTGIALAASFGRDADGAPMVDEDRPCPERCPMPEQVADLVAERDDVRSERDKWHAECRQRFTTVVHQCCEDVQALRASAVVLPEDWRQKIQSTLAAAALKGWVDQADAAYELADLVGSWRPAAVEATPPAPLAETRAAVLPKEGTDAQ